MGGFETQRAFYRFQEHPKRILDEEVMAVRSWRTQPENLLEVKGNPGCCTPCVLLHFGLIYELKGFGIWIYLFQGDMLSYESSLFRNLNHSIRMSDAKL